MNKLVAVGMIWGQFCWGWGEVGHHIIARVAVDALTSHPTLTALRISAPESTDSFLKVLRSKQYQQGHLANIPDTHWRNLDQGLEEVGNLLGSPAHYFDSESFLTPLGAKDFSSVSIPLSYSEVKRKLPQFAELFKEGSLPWRAQQLSELYRLALSRRSGKNCTEGRTGEEQTREVLTYAGLMSHFTGDVSMPYHTSIDHDAVAVGQKGIHSYFEQDLVSELELSGLYGKVLKKAQLLMNGAKSPDETPTLDFLTQKSRSLYPTQLTNEETTALMMVVIANSFSLIEKLRQLDYTYAIASLDEAITLAECSNLPVVRDLKKQYDALTTDEQKQIFGKVKVLSYPSDFHDRKTPSACRRSPSTRVNSDGNVSTTGKTVAEWHEDLIVSRMALSAVLTAEIWVKEWVRMEQPKLCATYLYAHKPSFISPTDSRCLGYALNESPKQFILKNGKSALGWKSPSKKQTYCVTF